MEVHTYSNIEKTHVQDVYNKIASDFDRTRYYQWKGIKDFINSLQNNSLIADIGCGNGKNMIDNRHIFIGFDFSIEFAKICNKKGIQSIVANNTNIPSRDNFFDHTISVAVIHHLSTELQRKKCINELIRITKPGGKIFIEVWSFERETGEEFKEQDNMIRWKHRDTGKVYQRFYHLFKKNELEDLIPKNISKIISSKYERNNYIVIIQKL